MKKQIEKNLLISANLLANLLGVVIINLVQGDIVELVAPQSVEKTNLASMIFDPLVFSFCLTVAFIFERPMRQCFAFKEVTDAPSTLLENARRRILLTPYFYIGLNLSAWLVAAIVYPLVLSKTGAPVFLVVRMTAQCIIVGIITCSLAFFLVEAILQRRFMTKFFPRGGVFTISGIPRTLILTRLIALFVISGFVPCLVSLLMANGMHQVLALNQLDSLEVVNMFSSAMTVSGLIFMGTGLTLAMLVSITLASPFREIIATLQEIEKGNLSVWLPTHSTDEVGYTCESINKMTDGLREKERLRKSLDLAGMVQKSLLPDSSPKVPGLDIAGLSLPCDETGGDYYDFIKRGDDDSSLDIIVGDVVGHGISSALLMTSVRAMVRTRCELGGSYADIVRDVNKLLCKDVGETGHFVTMFYFGYDATSKMMSWVRAGHDPAFFYNSKTDDFQELREGGPSLGLQEEAKYSSGAMPMAEGTVLLIGTDGVWETCSRENGFFGKERVREIIRDNAHNSAQQILDNLLKSLDDFRNDDPVEDDTTAVVIKVA